VNRAGLQVARLAVPSNQISFQTDILPLFTASNIACMRGQSVFLDDYTYISDASGDAFYPDHCNARHIFNRLSGTTEGRRMPLGGLYWTAQMLGTFDAWMLGGFQQ
jgi:hypothetical protein